MEMTKTHPIVTTGKDGRKYNFLVEEYPVEVLGNSMIAVRFHVKENSLSERHFVFIVDRQSFGGVRVYSMSHQDNNEYKGKGIAEGMIKFVSELYRTPAKSSSTKTQCPPQIGSRFDSGTKFWERLRVEGKAVYDDRLDVYTYLANDGE